MKIDEMFPNGVMSQMNHINSEKVSQLFPSESDITDFDNFFLSKNYDREVSNVCVYFSEKSKLDAFLSGILTADFPNWLREKQALEAEYDVLFPRQENFTTSETRNINKKDERSGSEQNKVNAFDSEVASDTTSIDTNGNATSESTSTFEKTSKRNESSVSVSQSELITRELRMRAKNKFFEIVSLDIANEVCAVIY